MSVISYLNLNSLAAKRVRIDDQGNSHNFSANLRKQVIAQQFASGDNSSVI